MKDVRPTSGRVLLALFSVLGSSLGSLENLAFLDLFAGTGRVGIEALKRGAAPVVLVETLKNRARDIEQALSSDRCDATVLALELRRALAWLSKRERVFDVVFADPPYNEGWGTALLKVSELTRVLKPKGLMVVEHATRETLVPTDAWEVADVRPYGESTLTFLKLKFNESPAEKEKSL